LSWKKKGELRHDGGKIIPFSRIGLRRDPEIGFFVRSCAELRLGFFKLAQGITFGVNAEAFRIDVRAAKDFATCCGVNLAVAALGFGFCRSIKAGEDLAFAS
jgi:hypothetical protein